MIIIYIMLIILWIQVRIDLSLADRVWQNKRTAIAQGADGLGAQFRPAMRADDWLKYIKDKYAAEQAQAAIGPSIGQGKVVVDDWRWFAAFSLAAWEWWFAASASPPEIMEANFHNEYSPEMPFVILCILK